MKKSKQVQDKFTNNVTINRPLKFTCSFQFKLIKYSKYNKHLKCLQFSYVISMARSRYRVSVYNLSKRYESHSRLDADRRHLKEYHGLINEARPLSGFFPTDADLFTEMHF